MWPRQQWHKKIDFITRDDILLSKIKRNPIKNWFYLTWKSLSKCKHWISYRKPNSVISVLYWLGRRSCFKERTMDNIFTPYAFRFDYKSPLYNQLCLSWGVFNRAAISLILQTSIYIRPFWHRNIYKRCKYCKTFPRFALICKVSVKC